MSNDLMTWDKGIKQVVDNATSVEKVIFDRLAVYVIGESTTETDGKFTREVMCVFKPESPVKVDVIRSKVTTSYSYTDGDKNE